MRNSIVWFRNDLRLHDNEALTDAIRDNDGIIPVYIFDERIFCGKTKNGFPKTHALRAKFIIESVTDLRKSLRKLGSDLLVHVGKPEELIAQLSRKYKCSWVYCNRERTSEEVKVQDALENKLWQIGQEVRYYRGKMLYYTADLPFPISHCPDIFSQFRKEVEKYIPVRPPMEFIFESIETQVEAEDIGAIPDIRDFGWDESDVKDAVFKGGETEALKQLYYYLWETDLISTYKETRNGFLGRDYSSKFSPFLAQGCISPKKIFDEIKRYEQERTKNKSTYWLIFELYWRDFFRFMAKKHGNNIFKISGTKNEGSPEYVDKPELFEKWKEGKTGIPFIDANMRELNATGYMSNRGRQNVASFLVKDLRLNWLLGAEYFESKLVDYDPCSNYGNWNYVAGVGSDPRENRYFNIASQARRYDPDADYVKHWIPELKNAPAELIHNPFIDHEKNLSRDFNYHPPCIHVKNW
jgi:deoxyribodipyrimidine photo-lyase